MSTLSPCVYADRPTSIERARALMGEADFEAALKVLRTAESVTVDSDERALIRKELGAVELVLGHRREALDAFVGALLDQPSLMADPNRDKQAVLRHLECARTLVTSNRPEAEIRALVDLVTEDPDWACPALPSLPAPPPPPPPGQAPVELTTNVDTCEGCRATWLWSFLGVGLGVAAGGLAVDASLDSSKNGTLDGADFAGPAMMLAGAIAVLVGLFANPYPDTTDPAAEEGSAGALSILAHPQSGLP